MRRKPMCITIWSDLARQMREMGVPPRDWAIVGSTLICGEGSDVDVLCYTKNPDFPSDYGFKPDISEELYDSNFQSWRKDDLNILVTGNRDYFSSEVTIAEAAALLNENKTYDMSKRDGRVAFHRELRGRVSSYITSE